MLASLSLSRIIAHTPNLNVDMPLGMTPEQRRGTCGILVQIVPSVLLPGGCMTLRHALPAKRFCLTCDKTRRPLRSPAKLGSSGIGPRQQVEEKIMWRCIPSPTCACCCGQTPLYFHPMRRSFHRHPQSASKDSLVSSDRSDTSPVPPVGNVV